MSRKVNNGYSRKCLIKHINGVKIYLYRSFDLVHGYGYFVYAFFADGRIGFGYDRKRAITAVRQGLINY